MRHLVKDRLWAILVGQDCGRLARPVPRIARPPAQKVASGRGGGSDWGGRGESGGGGSGEDGARSSSAAGYNQDTIRCNRVQSGAIGRNQAQLGRQRAASGSGGCGSGGGGGGSGENGEL